MESVSLSQEAYAIAVNAARERGYHSVGAYLQDVINEDVAVRALELNWSPEKLKAEIQIGLDAVTNGQVLTLEQAEARLDEVARKWREDRA